MKLRIAETSDLPAIVEIYNQAVATKQATAELTPVSVEGRSGWFAAHTPAQYPIFVAQSDDAVVGWCSLSAYRPGRLAFRYTAEISYYIHEDFRRMGIGTQLVGFSVEQGRARGFKSLIAMLLDVNIGSIRLLEKLGFQKWGQLPRVADFDGKEYGHLFYGLRIAS